MKKQYAILIYLVIISSFSYAQNDTTDTTQLYKVEKLLLNNAIPHFIRNPASTGLSGQRNIDLTGGMIWTGIIDVPLNIQLSYSGQIKKSRKTSIGGYFRYEREGMNHLNSFGLSGAHHFRLSKKSNLSIGTNLNILTIHEKYGSIYPDMIDPLYGPIFPTSCHHDLIRDKYQYLTFQIGILFDWDNFFAGASMSINNYNYMYSMFELVNEVSGCIGKKFNINKNFKIIPALNILYYLNYPKSNIQKITPSLGLTYRDKILIELCSDNFNTFNMKAGMLVNEKITFFLQSGTPLEKELFIYVNKIYFFKAGISYYF